MRPAAFKIQTDVPNDETYRAQKRIIFAESNIIYLAIHCAHSEIEIKYKLSIPPRKQHPSAMKAIVFTLFIGAIMRCEGTGGTKETDQLAPQDRYLGIQSCGSEDVQNSDETPQLLEPSTPKTSVGVPPDAVSSRSGEQSIYEGQRNRGTEEVSLNLLPFHSTFLSMNDFLPFSQIRSPVARSPTASQEQYHVDPISTDTICSEPKSWPSTPRFESMLSADQTACPGRPLSFPGLNPNAKAFQPAAASVQLISPPISTSSHPEYQGPFYSLYSGVRQWSDSAPKWDSPASHAASYGSRGTFLSLYAMLQGIERENKRAMTPEMKESMEFIRRSIASGYENDRSALDGCSVTDLCQRYNEYQSNEEGQLKGIRLSRRKHSGTSMRSLFTEIPLTVTALLLGYSADLRTIGQLRDLKQSSLLVLYVQGNPRLNPDFSALEAKSTARALQLQILYVSLPQILDYLQLKLVTSDHRVNSGAVCTQEQIGRISQWVQTSTLEQLWVEVVDREFVGVKDYGHRVALAFFKDGRLRNLPATATQLDFAVSHAARLSGEYKWGQKKDNRCFAFME